MKKTFSNGRGGCEVKKSRCITHNKKLVKESKVKQKRVIGINGDLEVKSIVVPELVCPSSALGESLYNPLIRQQTRKPEDLTCDQTIEGKVNRGIKAADRGS